MFIIQQLTADTMLIAIIQIYFYQGIHEILNDPEV